MKKASAMMVVLSVLVLLSGCTTRMVDYTIISTKNVDVSAIGKYSPGEHRVIGEDVKHGVFIIPAGMPDMKEAIDDAIEQVPGAVAMLDGVVYYKAWGIPFIYGQRAFVVEGTPLISIAKVDEFNREAAAKKKKEKALREGAARSTGTTEAVN